MGESINDKLLKFYQSVDKPFEKGYGSDLLLLRATRFSSMEHIPNINSDVKELLFLKLLKMNFKKPISVTKVLEKMFLPKVILQALPNEIFENYLEKCKNNMSNENVSTDINLTDEKIEEIKSPQLKRKKVKRTSRRNDVGDENINKTNANTERDLKETNIESPPVKRFKRAVSSSPTKSSHNEMNEIVMDSNININSPCKSNIETNSTEISEKSDKVKPQSNKGKVKNKNIETNGNLSHKKEKIKGQNSKKDVKSRSKSKRKSKPIDGNIQNSDLLKVNDKSQENIQKTYKSETIIKEFKIMLETCDNLSNKKGEKINGQMASKSKSKKKSKKIVDNSTNGKSPINTDKSKIVKKNIIEIVIESDNDVHIVKDKQVNNEIVKKIKKNKTKSNKKSKSVDDSRISRKDKNLSRQNGISNNEIVSTSEIHINDNLSDKIDEEMKSPKMKRKKLKKSSQPKDDNQMENNINVFESNGQENDKVEITPKKIKDKSQSHKKKHKTNENEKISYDDNLTNKTNKQFAKVLKKKKKN